MTHALPETSLDEQILEALNRSPATTSELARDLSAYERTVRRRLRRLIKDGYVFSPTRGWYRITARGVAAIEPLPD